MSSLKQNVIISNWLQQNTDMIKQIKRAFNYERKGGGCFKVTWCIVGRWKPEQQKQGHGLQI